jgi:hypothetical protein
MEHLKSDSNSDIYIGKWVLQVLIRTMPPSADTRIILGSAETPTSLSLVVL